MDIALAFDSRYLFYACVTMESVLQHHPRSFPTFWIVVSDDVDPDVSGALESVVGPRGTVNVVRAAGMADYGRSPHPSVSYVTEAMYLRLEVPDVIPSDVSRVLYLDADVVCTSRGLEALFDLGLAGNILGAVRDATTRRLIDNGGLPALARLPQLDPQSTYFNSGVLLFDTAAWRSAGIRRACEEYLTATATERRFPDQDALNVACYGRWARLNKRWNHQRFHRLDTHRGDNLSEAVLVHFNSTVKPWHLNFPPGRAKALYERLASRVGMAVPRPEPTVTALPTVDE